jgi:hypothetical protein
MSSEKERAEAKWDWLSMK